MQIICVSRGTLGGGQELAKRLAKKLGCACLSREELIEAVTDEGIQVGRLEMAMIKPWIFGEQLAIEREYYLAFTTAYLCDRAMEGRLVYHGRTGHLLLPGVDHVLSVRVVSDEEQRIGRVVKELGVDRTKARRYLREVDEDRKRWARSMYGIGWEDAAHYDLVVNLQHMTVENAASALTAVSQLPDFQMTPASQRAMADLWLAAQSRVALARHERTSKAKFKVRADAGVVTVTFLPQDSRYADFIPEALAPLADVSEVHATMATTNILWIQERFASASEAFQEVVDLATKWNAAVELLRLAPADAQQTDLADHSLAAPEPGASGEYNGGIEHDVEEASSDDGGVKSTLDELAAAGRSGGSRVVYGEAQDLLDSLARTRAYSLVVLGDLFLEKGHAARLRMTRELQRFVSDHIAAPVVGADELKAQYLFGRRDVARLGGFLALVAVVYFLVFYKPNQLIILEFLYGQWWGGGLLTKLVVAAAVFVFVPIIAHCYGTVAKSLMKLIKME
ncbi:MAG: cytidylate kinase-like family protein [Chloroflexota bacterium]